MSEVPLLPDTSPFRGRTWKNRVGSLSEYRGTSLRGNRTPLGRYRRPTRRVVGGSCRGGRFLVGEVPL